MWYVPTERDEDRFQKFLGRLLTVEAGTVERASILDAGAEVIEVALGFADPALGEATIIGHRGSGLPSTRS